MLLLSLISFQVFLISVPQAHSSDHEVSFSELLKDYDPNLRPGFGTTQADACEFDILVYQIGPVSEATMSLTTDMYLRQMWRDKRVTDAVAPLFNELPLSNKSRFLSLTRDMAKQLWKPNIYFKDALRESTPQEVSQSQFLRVYENGNILSSKRVLLTTRCALELRFFPLDLQLCRICLESYELDDSEQMVKWKNQDLSMSDQSTATFNVDNEVVLTTTTIYYEGLGTYYTHLCMEVRLTRKLTMYIVTMYLPSVALVILSWVSFWIDKKAVPARAGLTITTILAQITLITGTANKFPGIADLKLGDTYMIVNFFFVFGSLIEFAMVSGQDQHRMRAIEAKAEESKQLLEENDNKATGDGEVQTTVPQANMLKRLFVEKFEGDIDLVSRRLFPVCFAVWNLLYFILGFGLRTY